VGVASPRPASGLDDGVSVCREAIVKGKALGDATQDRRLDFFLTLTAQRRSDSQ
jgi:hypothetical protein